MRITITRIGGFAATVTAGLPPTVVDTDDLPADTATVLADAARDALTEDGRRPAARPTRRVPDAVTYRVEVGDAGRTREMSHADGDDAPAFWRLLDLLGGVSG
ncbi:hypothetical protein GCM10023094_43210 [Rhodococcus olei]|uniref:Uncharacterized protein n=1 Tax=Rhodococcus olei TaxID=2161675 RepID=A0ABP8PG12_9NOCA